MIEGKIPSIVGQATTTALHVVENKTSNVSSFVKKINYYVNTSGIEKRCFTASAYNIFTTEMTDNHRQLRFTQQTCYNSSKSRFKSITRENGEIQAFYSSYFRGKSEFKDGGIQKSLVF